MKQPKLSIPSAGKTKTPPGHSSNARQSPRPTRQPPHEKRNPDRTREVLLRAAFDEIHRCGFQAASVDAILARTGVTKGALYYHFPTKTQLGYAVVEEVIRQRILQRWGHELGAGEDPLAHLIEKLRHEARHRWSLEALQVGCPVNNLANEMSPIDEGFRQRIEQVFHDWRAIIAQMILQGQRSGQVRVDVKPEQVATFFVAAVEGTIGLAKNAQDPKLLRDNFAMLQTYLAALRPPLRKRQSPPTVARTKRTESSASA
ncbi:MAG: TetR family transcriptional regulator C-terminal domain-containing protein [Candidatus Binatia bacterium]